MATYTIRICKPFQLGMSCAADGRRAPDHVIQGANDALGVTES
ncbi:hypothetical protein [Caulobacter segnis]|nr:hypothetical protein [Caulobacter segnis]